MKVGTGFLLSEISLVESSASILSTNSLLVILSRKFSFFRRVFKTLSAILHIQA